MLTSLEPVTTSDASMLPAVGAEVGELGVHFRVWAPKHPAVDVIVGREGATRTVPLQTASGREGFFHGFDREARAGDRYRFRVGQDALPDPASRFQPDGVEGWSQIVDPASYAWRATEWRRPSLRGRVIYELHVGTFTQEGTFRAAMEKLDALVDLGVNTLELMPLADFAGRWNWGYDGVMLFAPARCYGTPDDLRSLIDAAHERGLAVILDVVYNHLGPTGNVVQRYSDDYFHREHESMWGQSLNFDGRNSAPVRAFFLQNVRMWLDEYRIDGLRLDAVHAIHDASEPHLVSEMAMLAEDRGAFVIAEDDRNDPSLVSPKAAGGRGVHGVWADDFHHAVRVALTGEQQAYYANYQGTIDQLVETLQNGWYYQGQIFPTTHRARGGRCGHLNPEAFVYCISNHDQAGNRPTGDRLHEVVSPAAYRAASMLLCFVPYTPMIFQGQEWAASTRFPFFTDHPGQVGADMRKNRIKEHGASYGVDVLAQMPDPQAESTFLCAKLKWAERARPPHAEVLALYRECLAIRGENSIFQSPERTKWSVQRCGQGALTLRWLGTRCEWCLVVTLRPGAEKAECLEGPDWEQVLDSADARFGGSGNSDLQRAVLWRRFLQEPAGVALD